MSERKVSTDALETLGTIIDDTQKRDAIHLAVAPVRAVQRLMPGDHITIVEGRASKARTGDGHGIVDPFLEQAVRPGETFWFVMYPRKVTSLRHVWAHPDFPDEVGTEAASLGGITKASAEAWLRDFCAKGDCPDFLTVMQIVENGDDNQWDSNYLHFTGFDAHGEIPAEFWVHAEAYLGHKIDRKPAYFSCGC